MKTIADVLGVAPISSIVSSAVTCISVMILSFCSTRWRLRYPPFAQFAPINMDTAIRPFFDPSQTDG
jgi:hypothetical protein